MMTRLSTVPIRHASTLATAAARPSTHMSGVLFYTWWGGDPRPTLPALPGFSAARSDEYQLIADMAGLDRAEVLARVRAGHRPFLAWLWETPVAYGWSAVGQASIGELGVALSIPAANRYLWDFATLPAWRGRGVYPHLLQAIISQEAAEAERFWIGHVPGNIASGRGMSKAGFRQIGTADRLGDGRVYFVSDTAAKRAWACATLLGARLRGRPARCRRVRY
jgi:GNAT superfamily N-acetyltransferase